MEQELWRKVEELFHAALERTPGERKAFLDGTCGTDRELRRQVELLLAKGEQAGSFLEVPAIENLPVTLTEAGSLLGRQFGPYHILSPLGAGGMGEVYRAHDSTLGRDVAIKTLPPEFARNPERLSRLHREARTLASLNHPNIAAIYGLEESDGAVYLVLELVEGETLRGALPVNAALDRACQVAAALEAAHDKGIIHRDLKPANVKVTPQGRVKVLDFGLAKAIWGSQGTQDLSQLTTVTGVESVAGQIVGTPGYMSPEQARGQEVDKRTDVWAFGCVLYELLAGRRAFAGETLTDSIAAVLEREPDWHALPAKLPSKIRGLLRQCLQKDPGRRPDIADARRAIEDAQRRGNRWRVAAVAAAAVAMLVSGAALWLRDRARPADRSEWVQLTHLPDSVSQPALSPDGRMLAFVRGYDTTIGAGEVYVKILPDGEPVQLTHEPVLKMSPTFSPDGSRIAYTTLDPKNFHWDTWVVPTLGGQPQPLLRNASGLVWTGPQQVLFSEIKSGIRMGIVAADENRAGARDVYLPEGQPDMAHQSYLSPDGKWVLLAEMDHDHFWLPCRLVPLDGSTTGQHVGPLGGGCTSAAWSRDGKWMYFTADPGGVNHIWRQRFSDGQPEQLTSGPTEEEGIAMAPDGRSFVTAVALRNTSLWVHDAKGEHQVSLEGNAANPKFTPDGKRMCYLVGEATTALSWHRNPGELRIADLETGRSEPVVRGFAVIGYDISDDGQKVVLWTADREGKTRLWLARIDRGTPPMQIPNVEGSEPMFGPDGDIFFRHLEGMTTYLYRIHPDGTGLRKALAEPVFILFDVSPDRRWIVAWGPLPGDGTPAILAYPLDGGPPRQIGDGFTRLSWTLDGRSALINSYFVPLAPGEMFPKIPAGGFHSDEEIARLPGARRIEGDRVVPGPSPETYAFYRGTTQRNLYRIPIP